MKILLITDFFNENLQYQENILAKYYIKHGHEVVVLTGTNDNVFEFVVERYDKTIKASSSYFNGIKIIREPYSINILHKIRKLSNIAEILEREKPDLIFSHYVDLTLVEASRFVKKNPSCRLIVASHSDYSNSAKNWLSLNILSKIIRKSFMDRAKPYLSKIFYVVPAGGQFLNEVYGVPYSDMELLILGSDLDLVNTVRNEGQGDKIRQKFNISDNETVVITGGKFVPFKKTELLIQALFKISNPNWHLFIIGDSDEANKEYKDSLINLSNGDSRIHFEGWLNTVDVFKYLSASDLAVFPQSQTVLWQQSLSCGLPLIVGLVGGNEVAYLNKYECIIELTEPEITVDVIAAKVENLMNNKELLEDMKNRARKTSDELLNYDNLVLQTLR
jgi:1,2-diacylglycerol 3-alpha-glucosyltransferase